MQSQWEAERGALAIVRRFNATLSAKGYVWFWPKINAALTSKHHSGCPTQQFRDGASPTTPAQPDPFADANLELRLPFGNGPGGGVVSPNADDTSPRSSIFAPGAFFCTDSMPSMALAFVS